MLCKNIRSFDIVSARQRVLKNCLMFCRSRLFPRVLLHVYVPAELKEEFHGSANVLFSSSLIFVEFLDGYPPRCSVGGGNEAAQETVTQGEAKEARSKEKERERELPADGFLRFSSVRVSWIWRIRLVCSPPRAPRLFSPLYFSFLLLSLSRAIRSREPSRTERTSYLPVLPDGCYVSAGGETEWKRAGRDEKDEETERMYRRTDLLFVTRVCANSSFVSLPCLPVYKRPAEGDDVLPSVTVHHLSSILPVSLVPLSLLSATGDDTAAATAPGKWANKGGTGGRLVALAPDFGMRPRASEEHKNSC